MARIDLNRVATFVRVAQAGSFTAAAAALGLPTSSVSRAVANLEEELGARLIHRTTRKLHLTEAGQQYFERMQAVLADAEDANQAVLGQGEPRGLVRITAPADLGVRELPAVLARLCERHPRLVIDVVLTSRRVDLIEDGIDLAIRGGRLDDSSLVARKVASTDLGIFATAGYLKRRGRPRTTAELAAHDCIVYHTRAGKVPWRLSGPGGEETVAVNPRLLTDDMTFVREATLAGAGLGLMPIPIVADDVKDKRLLRVLPEHAVKGGGLYLVWPSRTLMPTRVAVVRDHLIEALSRLVAK